MLAVTLSEFGDVDLNSSFFDTLREDYEGVAFDNWFKKKARNKEKAYIFKNESGLLQGFLKVVTPSHALNFTHHKCF